MTPMQQALTAKLSETCELSPDIRFGQLLANIGLLTEGQTDQSLWDIIFRSVSPLDR